MFSPRKLKTLFADFLHFETGHAWEVEAGRYLGYLVWPQVLDSALCKDHRAGGSFIRVPEYQWGGNEVRINGTLIDAHRCGRVQQLN